MDSFAKYFWWSEEMQSAFDERLLRMPTQPEDLVFVAQMDAFIWVSYWHGSLYVVVEGWRELGLRDAEIDGLLLSQYVDVLRRYRNGTFHFQRRYMGNQFSELFKQGDAIVTWVRQLSAAFKRFIDNWYETYKSSNP